MAEGKYFSIITNYCGLVHDCSIKEGIEQVGGGVGGGVGIEHVGSGVGIEQVGGGVGGG